MDCLFCNIITKKIPAHIVYEDEMVLAFLDIFPKTKGHTLVIPKKHSKNIYHIDDQDLAHVSAVAKKIAVSMQDSLKTAGVNLLQSNEAAAQQTVFHFHMHVIPRYDDDQEIVFKQDEPAEHFESIAQTIAAKL